MPLLPHLGREGAFRRIAADRNLHDLPFPDLDQRADAGAGAGEPGREQADPLAARATSCPATSTSITPFISPRASAARPATARSIEMKLTRQAAPLTMKWCLDCHRDPAKAHPPARSRVRSRLEAVRQQRSGRTEAGRRLSHPHRPPDGLLDMPPVNELPVKGSQFYERGPTRAQPASGAEPARHRHRDRPRRLQQALRSRSFPMSSMPEGVVPGEAAEIRDDAAAFGVRTRCHRHFDRRAPDQGRGQSAASGKPRRDRRLRRSRGIVAVRSGPLAHRAEQRRDRFATKRSGWRCRPQLQQMQQRSGEGFRLLTGRVTSPTLLRQIDDLLQLFPKAAWHAYEPIDDETRTCRRRAGLRQAAGDGAAARQGAGAGRPSTPIRSVMGPTSCAMPAASPRAASRRPENSRASTASRPRRR